MGRTARASAAELLVLEGQTERPRASWSRDEDNETQRRVGDGDIIGWVDLVGRGVVGVDSDREFAAEVDRLSLMLRCEQWVAGSYEKTMRDALTGLYNRRFFDEMLAKSLFQAGRSGNSAAVLLFDIDDFKSINDTFGHAAGDEALVGLSAAASHALRSADVLARVGGEEFVAILHDAPQDVARNVAERVRSAAEGVRAGSAGGLSVSLGIAVFPEDADNPRELLKRADDALYWAKANGKNVCSSASELNAVDAQERERVRAAVIELIIKGDLPGGAPIDEQRLGRELGTFRRPLREALVALRAEGLVRPTAGGTFAVAPLTCEEVMELYPQLGALEALALTSCSLSEEKFAKLGTINAELTHPTAVGEARIALDRRWHDVLLGDCGNASLLAQTRQLKRRLHRYQLAFMGKTPTMQPSADQHSLIVSALRAGDIKTAQHQLELNWQIGVENLLPRLASAEAQAHG